MNNPDAQKPTNSSPFPSYQLRIRRPLGAERPLLETVKAHDERHLSTLEASLATMNKRLQEANAIIADSRRELADLERFIELVAPGRDICDMSWGRIDSHHVLRGIRLIASDHPKDPYLHGIVRGFEATKAASERT